MRYREFLIFKMVVVRPLGFLKLKFFLLAMHFRDALGVIMPNFVEIGYTIVEISQFCSVFL